MARLPTPGSDNGQWGQILNDFLAESHNSDGTIKAGAVSKASIGLDNVDNTSDANKPVSAATQVALDTEVNAIKSKLVLNVRDYGAKGDQTTNDTAAINAALAAASASANKPAVYFPAGIYRVTSAITPFTGMTLVSDGRASEFGRGAMLLDLVTDMFTPTADVTDITFSNIQFQGNTSSRTTDWWTVGTGFQILYSHIDGCGFTGFKRIYHGNWTGVTFQNFYANGQNTQYQSFKLGGADSIFGPGFVGAGGYARTTLTASVTSGAGPKTITVADATGAAVGGVVYIGDKADGSSSTKDTSTITAVSGNQITVGTLTNSHASGEYVHIVLSTPAVEIQLSHSKIDRVYVSSGPGMAMHVTGGHSSMFINCELSGSPAISAGPGLYVNGADGHLSLGTNISGVAYKAFNQFNGAAVVYDSTDITFIGTLFDAINNSAPILFRLGKSTGTLDRIKIRDTVYGNITGSAVKFSTTASIQNIGLTVDWDEFPITKAGAPTDADFFGVARDGFKITDTTNHRLYVRSGGTWRYTALT